MEPMFERGIPSSWAEIDPGNPPTFESEAVYLEKHGLLSPVEKRHLEKHPEKIKMEASHETS